MDNNNLTVFIVDDDVAVRDSLCLLLGLQGWRTACFDSADTFLRVFCPDWRGCLLLDIRMPGLDGLALQQKLLDLGCKLSVVIITGHGDVAAARTAFRQQAVDFLEKPLDDEKLLSALTEGMSRAARQGEGTVSVASAAVLSLERLTDRERQVMEKVVSGAHNREIAHELGISVRTVEVHKARLMDKLGTRTVADLVRLYLASGAQPA